MLEFGKIITIKIVITIVIAIIIVIIIIIIVSRTPVLYPVFSMRVSLPVFIQCTVMIDSRSHYDSHFGTAGKAGSRWSQDERASMVIRMFHNLMVSCVFWDTRALH